MRHPRRVLWIVAAALGVGLTAFSLGADSGALASGPERPYKVYAPGVSRAEGLAPSPALTPTPQPTPAPTPGEGAEINLAPQLDTAHAVSKLVTVSGGATLITTGADGSQYTLTLPANSVLFDVTVTVTPLKALAGLAATGGLRAGVQIEPDGMALGVPATLEIVPANPVPVTEEISFSYSGDGHQAYAYGMGVNASRNRFTILHFSGWAIGGGTEAQRATMFRSKVDSATNRISQRLAPIIEAERQRQDADATSDEGSAEFAAEIRLALEDGYREVVKPAMDTAEALADSGGIDAAEPGLQAFLSWERQLQLYGLDILQAERAALWQQMERIIDKVRKNMRHRCFDQHDLLMAIRLLGLARQQALLTGEAGPALDDAQKCLTFELDFETILTSWAGLKISEIHVRALGVPIRLGPDGSFPVTQPLELLSFTGDAPAECSYSADIHLTKPFQINSGRLVFSTKEGKTEITDIEFNIEPGDLAGSFTYHCPQGFNQTIPVSDGYLAGTFNIVHLDDIDPLQGGIRVVGWDMIRGGVFARKTYSQGAEPVTEQTDFTLKHAPE